MIDDMQRLFSHASEAFRAGKRSGLEEMGRLGLQALSQVSVAHESTADPAKFHAAEECCKAFRETRDALLNRKEIV